MKYKKGSRFSFTVGCLICLLSLFGCDSATKYKKQIEDLNVKIAQLQSQLNAYENDIYTNPYAGGAFQCELSGARYSLSIRFLAKTVVFFDARDVDDMVIFHNYYLFQEVDKNRFAIVADVDVKDNWGPKNFVYLMGSSYFKVLQLSDDGNKINLIPSEYEAVCTFVKDQPKLDKTNRTISANSGCTFIKQRLEN